MGTVVGFLIAVISTGFLAAAPAAARAAETSERSELSDSREMQKACTSIRAVYSEDGKVLSQSELTSLLSRSSEAAQVLNQLGRASSASVFRERSRLVAGPQGERIRIQLSDRRGAVLKLVGESDLTDLHIDLQVDHNDSALPVTSVRAQAFDSHIFSLHFDLKAGARSLRVELSFADETPNASCAISPNQE